MANIKSKWWLSSSEMLPGPRMLTEGSGGGPATHRYMRLMNMIWKYKNKSNQILHIHVNDTLCATVWCFGSDSRKHWQTERERTCLLLYIQVVTLTVRNKQHFCTGLHFASCTDATDHTVFLYCTTVQLWMLCWSQLLCRISVVPYLLFYTVCTIQHTYLPWG